MASANNNSDRLVIFKGDDTGGAFGRTLAFTIEAAEGVSLDGCRAEWIFDGIVKAIDAPLVPGEVREVFYSHNETRRMAIGVRYGTFRIIDAAGKVRTFTNTKAVEVTDNVARCYPGSSSAAVHIGTTVTWEQVSGKPLLVKTINGEPPDANGNIQIVTGGDVKHVDFADIEEKEGMTLKEVGSMCNALVRKLKGTVAAFAALLAFGAFAEEVIPLSPDIDFGDIHPTNKLKAVVEASGAISGVDTNAVRDIVRDVLATNGIRSVDGAARQLPKYLHALDFCDSYTNEAAAYYRSRGDGRVDGGCSSVRSGGYLCRNFDYPFDYRSEFVVKMSAGQNRFASVGVAQVGTNLTEQIVISGKWSKWYKALPGATVDGINENGVVAEINVVDTPVAGWHTNATDKAIHPLAAVRWVLDNATNAQSAAQYIAANIRFPVGWTQNFHYMIADTEKTYIVENGTAADGDEYHEPDEPVTMTNFQLSKFPWEGMGMERFGLLLSGGDITNAWYTRAYRRSTTPAWVSDLAEVIAYTNDIFDAWATHPKEYFRGKTNNGIPWWQTVHTSIYDITNRTLRVAVQETDDWYTFAVPSAGGSVDAYTRAETDDLLAEKADKTTKINGKPLSANVTLRTSDIENNSGYIANGVDDADKYYKFYELASMFGTGSKILREGNTVEKGQVFYLWSHDYSYWPFEWPFVFVRVKEGGPFSDLSDFIYGQRAGYAHAELLMGSDVRLPSLSDIPAPYVPSATDPTFSNAVLAVEFNFATNEVTSATYIAATNVLAQLGFDEDVMANLPGGKVYGSLGALLAALAAAVALLRKKTQLLKSDGTAEDDFAADLLGKQVAKEAIRANSAQLALDEDGEIIVTMNTED